jgi:hypothetical protein
VFGFLQMMPAGIELRERGEAGLCLRLVRTGMHEHADPPHPVSLLRPRRERPSCPAPPSSAMNSRRLN